MNTHQTHIVQLGNSKGIRIPKEYLSTLGTSKVILEATKEGILIKPIPDIIPRSKWGAILAHMDTTTIEKDLQDFDICLSDGIEDV